MAKHDLIVQVSDTTGDASSNAGRPPKKSIKLSQLLLGEAQHNFYENN